MRLFKREQLTLHLETRELRGLVFKGQQILRWASQPLPEGALHNHQVAQPGQLAKAIAALQAALDIHVSKADISFNHNRAILRVLDLPPVPDKLLPEAVQREARREFPLPLDELYLSWHPIANHNRAGRQRIFTVGIPRAAIDTYIVALQRAKLQPRTLDLKPLTLIRAANHRDIVLVDAEIATSHIIIVRDFIPYLVRSIAMPGDALASALEQGVYLSSELERTIDFYRSSMMAEHGPWSPQVCLTGLLAHTPEIREELAASWMLVDPEPTLAAPKDLPLHTYLPNIGLMLKQV